MTAGRQQSVRFGPNSGSVRRAPSHRLKRSRSQYMSSPHLNYSTSNWQLNHLNANFRKSQNSVYINMQQAGKGTYTNRHIASAHKLIDGLNEDDPTFKSRLRSVISSYNFQLLMVVLVILDCIMVLGEMIIEMQLGNCGGGHGNEHHIEEAIGHVTESTLTTLVSNFTVQPEVVTEGMAVAESAAQSATGSFSPCNYTHLLHEMEKYFHLTSIFILFTFNVELVLRLYIFGCKYFLHLENALDAIVVIVSFWLDVAFLDSSMKKYLYLLIILRLWRVLRIIHAIIHAIKTPFERQIEKLKKKRKILQRDLAKAYFYSNMLEEEITNLRGRVSELEASQREADEETAEEDDDEDTKADENNNKTENAGDR